MISKLPPTGVIGPAQEKLYGVSFPSESRKILNEKRMTPQKNKRKIQGVKAEDLCEKIKSASP